MSAFNGVYRGGSTGVEKFLIFRMEEGFILASLDESSPPHTGRNRGLRSHSKYKLYIDSIDQSIRK